MRITGNNSNFEACPEFTGKFIRRQDHEGEAGADGAGSDGGYRTVQSEVNTPKH